MATSDGRLSRHPAHPLFEKDGEMIQIIEEVERRHLGVIGEDIISAYVGKKTGKLLGFKISSGDKIRDISLSEIDRMKQILALM